jgi:nitrite reductase/ring-hydroxylating ferredoxin subunit
MMKHPLIAVADIPETGSVIVDFFGRSVHVYRVDGQPRAVANVCMHFGGPLEMQADCTLVCGWHNARFNARTGQRTDGPAPAQSRLMFLSTLVEDGVLNYVWGS